MGTSVLSPRSQRRLARLTGQDVVRGWSHGGYTMHFVTPDHRHGWLNKKTGEWGWHGPDTLEHYTSCRELFPTGGAGHGAVSN